MVINEAAFPFSLLLENPLLDRIFSFALPDLPIGAAISIRERLGLRRPSESTAQHNNGLFAVIVHIKKQLWVEMEV